MRAENDWVAAQVQRHPDRLRAFCSFNPLRDYALRELERCAADPAFRGIKLHAGNSGIDLTNAADLAKLRDVFAAADRHRLPIVIHLRTFGHPYGRAAAEGFLQTVLPAAPDIPVQIAHLAGSGPGYEDPPSDSALQVFADAISRGDPRTRHLLFDVATMVDAHISPATAARVAARIRQIGPERILWGSDLAARGNPTPREGWAYFRGLLPLTEAELATIARNVAPYMR